MVQMFDTDGPSSYNRRFTSPHFCLLCGQSHWCSCPWATWTFRTPLPALSLLETSNGWWLCRRLHTLSSAGWIELCRRFCWSKLRPRHLFWSSSSHISHVWPPHGEISLLQTENGKMLRIQTLAGHLGTQVFPWVKYQVGDLRWLFDLQSEGIPYFKKF